MPLEQLEDAKAWLISRKWSSGDKRFTSLFWIKFDDHSNEKKGKTSFWMSQDLQTFLNFVQISTLLSCPDQFMVFSCLSEGCLLSLVDHASFSHLQSLLQWQLINQFCVLKVILYAVSKGQVKNAFKNTETYFVVETWIAGTFQVPTSR